MPSELSTAFHPAAAFVASRHRDWLADRGANVIVDAAMPDLSTARSACDAAHRRGYQVHGVYVDVPYDTARARAAARWSTGLNNHSPQAPRGSEQWLGGRFLPEWYLQTNFPRALRGQAENRRTFLALATTGDLDRAQLFDGTRTPARLEHRWSHGERRAVTRIQSARPAPGPGADRGTPGRGPQDYER